MLKAFKYKLTPTPSQMELLNQHFGSVRLVYNMALAYKKDKYIDSSISISIYDIKKLLPEWKNDQELTFLKEVNSLSLQQSILNLDKSFQRFFKKQGGYPKFKSRKYSKPSFTVPQNTIVDFEAGTVSIPKFKTGIKCNFHRKFIGDIKSSTISQLPCGKYEIAILVNTRDEEGRELNYPEPIHINTITENQVVGIDMGLKDFLITSELCPKNNSSNKSSNKVANPTFLKRSLKRLKQLSKRHSKRTILSKKVCQYKNIELKLSQRTWTCNSCSTTHDRDLNAAINIKKQGYQLLIQPKKKATKIAA